jgi:hypothetical protein
MLRGGQERVRPIASSHRILGLSLQDDDYAENCRGADEPGGRLVPWLQGNQFGDVVVFLKLVGNVQFRAPSKQDEGAVWAGAIGGAVT